MLTITNESGDTFNVIIIKKGDRYGRDNCLTHEKDVPMVEFYDAEHPFDKDQHGNILGQFTSRYYTSTLLEDKRLLDGGLALQGGVTKWSVSGDNMKDVIAYIKKEIA